VTARERGILTRDERRPTSAVPSPRLALADSRRGVRTRARIQESDAEQLAELLLRDGERPCMDFVAGFAAQGIPLDVLLVDLLTPAVRRIGEEWTEDQVGFLEAGIAYGRAHQLLRRLAQEHDGVPADAEVAGRVLVTVPEGEQHTLGIFALAEVLLRQGWQVVLCRPLLEAHPATLVRGEWFDAVLYSLAQERHFEPVKREIARLRRRSRNPDVAVVVGGHVTTCDPNAWELLGADAVGGEADGVSALLHEILGKVDA
jgi:methanogenic corrinoid protein MtbC1